MRKFEKIIITIKDPKGYLMGMELPWDAGLADFITAFKIILKWLTFSTEQIEEIFRSESN